MKWKPLGAVLAAIGVSVATDTAVGADWPSAGADLTSPIHATKPMRS